ncbi:MAG TPA: SDR family NAD(P)-dependent oxidoreductase, partial [Solirubrobacterales bacterium]
LSPDQATDPAYWVAQVRQPVRFAKATETLSALGASTFLEIGPEPVLVPMATETLEAKGAEAALIATLRSGRAEPESIAKAIASAHASGAKLDWEAFFKGSGAKRVPLPTYPFQRERYWIAPSIGTGDVSSAGLTDPGHPLLGAVVEVAGGEDGDGLLLTGRISRSDLPWLTDHPVHEVPILPASAFLELALHAAERVGAEQIGELEVHSPLVLPEKAAVQLQVSVSGPSQGGRRRIAIHSRPEGGAEELLDGSGWTAHASGLLSTEPIASPEPLSGEETLAEVSLPDAQREEAERFAIHPALLEMAHAAADSEDEELWPYRWSEVGLFATGAAELRVAPRSDAEQSGLDLHDAAGAPVARIGSFERRAISAEELKGAGSRQEALLGIEWSEVELPVFDPAPNGAAQTLATIGELQIEGAERYASIDALLEALAAGQSAPQAVLMRVEAKAQKQEAKAAQALTQNVLELLQAWLGSESLTRSRLALLTTGAVPASGEELPDLSTAPLWGLLRSAQSEHPGRFGLIDSDDSEPSLGSLAAALAQTEEPQLALREGLALAPRLVRLASTQPGKEAAASLDPERTVLLTGATGGLGSLLARHLVAEHGVRHLLLISRSGEEAQGARELREELQELGAKVRIEACDASSRKQLKALIESIEDEHPLGAVIHAAGAVDDATIESLGKDQIERVFVPKAVAAWHLHELTRSLDLSTFVVFSSLAGSLGGPGQGNYAAANVFLDALAQKRQAEGLPAKSIAWGLWAEQGGMAGNLSEADLRRMEQGGIGALSAERGLALFDAALDAERPLAVAVHLHPTGLRALASVGALAPIMRKLVRTPPRRAAASTALLERLAGLSEQEREKAVLELVLSQVAAVLGHESAAAIDPEKAFQDLGFDSLAAVELRNRLGIATGMSLQPTLVFDYPSATKLAAHLLAELTSSGAARRLAVRAQASDEPIAILGMSCRFPGGATSPRALWQLVAEGRDGIGSFPEDRGWELDRFDAAEAGMATEGGFVDGVGDFDAEFFGIGPREALAMDPLQRLVLEATWEALEDAGIDPTSLRGTETGVFAGAEKSGYGGIEAMLGGYGMTGGAGSIVSGRLSYTLGLEGPAMTIDTACSSALVALHLGAQALRQGECSLALAGGVSVLATPFVFAEFSRQGGLASDGRCKSFAEAADGTGWSEGAGMITMQRLSDAERGGREILAVIRGSAVNQDGASNGLTAPNGPSQERVIRQALANARLEPREVDAVEAHGTGTTLGDPIEAGALLATYGQDRERPLKLGSIKSNIGHAQAAAGAAGVIKMVMAMREGVLPQTLHLDAPSSKVDWSAGEIELLAEPQPWEPGERPRRAGVSSFGVSGTNAHLILEEAPAREPV